MSVAVTSAVAYRLKLLGPSASQESLDDAVARAEDALKRKRFDNPPGDNVRDLTADAITKWPTEPRLLEVRARACDELVKDAIGRQLQGDLPGAEKLVQLARELDPTDTTAQQLALEYDRLALLKASSSAVVLASPDAGRGTPSAKAQVTAMGPFRTAMDVSPAKPHVGQPVDLVVKVTTLAGGPPKKPLEDPHFSVLGSAVGGEGSAQLPAFSDAEGIFRASFTFLAPGKYEVTFHAKSDTYALKANTAASSPWRRHHLRSARTIPPPAVTPPPAPPVAPAPPAAWLCTGDTPRAVARAERKRQVDVESAGPRRSCASIAGMRVRLSVIAFALATFAPLVARRRRTSRGRGAGARRRYEWRGRGSSVTVDPGPDNWILRRKHTIAEFELGFIALPNAPISASHKGGDLPLGATIGHGDATASIGMHFLYRGGIDWALGAGALFAPHPTADTTYGGASGLSRTHSRDYLWLGGEGRYIPLHLKTVEAWIGIVVGGVVIADRFTTTTPAVPSDLGTAQVTVRTEGFALGLQAGGEWEISEHVLLGLALRFDNWILPTGEQCTPIGDCPTLTGPVTEIEFGLRLGYRIPL